MLNQNGFRNTGRLLSIFSVFCHFALMHALCSRRTSGRPPTWFSPGERSLRAATWLGRASRPMAEQKRAPFRAASARSLHVPTSLFAPARNHPFRDSRRASRQDGGRASNCAIRSRAEPAASPARPPGGAAYILRAVRDGLVGQNKRVALTRRTMKPRPRFARRARAKYVPDNRCFETPGSGLPEDLWTYAIAGSPAVHP